MIVQSSRSVLVWVLLVASVSCVQADITTGLTGYWMMDDGVGAVATDRVGANDGLLQGDASWDEGYAGGAVLLDGLGDYVDCGSRAAFNITDAVTLAAWLQAEGDFSYPDWSGILMRGGPNIDTFALYYNGPTRQLGFKTTGTNPEWYASGDNTTPELFDGEWHHVAATYDGAIKVIYVDGNPRASVAATGRIETSNGRLLIGAGRDTIPPTLFVAGRIDEARLYRRGLSVADVKELFDTEPSSKNMAQSPSPMDRERDVPVDSVLAWAAGGSAATHDVYLTTAFADVNVADRAGPMNALASQGQTDTTYDPDGLLAYGQTYYWRVDEVNAAPDNTIFKGAVWSFTTEPYAYPLVNVTATASSAQTGMEAQNTVDGSGLNDQDQHSTEPTQMWMSAVKPAWIQFQFEGVYKLHEMWVWNSNQLVESFLGFGARNVAIEYSADGETWAPLEGVPEFGGADGTPTYMANTTVSFGGVLARFVKLTIDSNWGGIAPQTGLSEVRFFYVPLQAREPTPADGAAGIGLDTELSWRPGREATSHEVYFGADSSAVAGGSVPAETVTERRYSTGPLDFGTTYYWKIDEVGEAGVHGGDLWSFTTQEFAAIDDFERYTDDIDAQQTIWQAWIDGVTTGASGSQVGYTESPFAERAIVHGGRQSMPFAYDNADAPFYSEAELSLSPAQDWTSGGADTLSLWVRGGSANSPADLYVTVQDSAGKTATATSSTLVTAADWTQWKIPLSSLAGVNVKTVKKLILGVDSRNRTTKGAGTLYIDDIDFGRPAQSIDR